MKKSILTGKYTNYFNLNTISNYINEINVKNNNTKGYHIWTENITGNIYNIIEEVRLSNEILTKINKQYPNCRIKNVRNIDEIYWAVSPKNATGSDRTLVDCHYDTPFGILPTNNIVFYRIILACNENYTIETSFPKNNVKVKMNIGDFHGLDYSKDWHCVKGKIPPNKYRVLLKLHYLIIPESYEDNTISERFVYNLNVSWGIFSRNIMRISSNPKNNFENLIADTFNTSRYLFNNCKEELCYFIFVLFVSVIIFIKNTIRK